MRELHTEDRLSLRHWERWGKNISLAMGERGGCRRSKTLRGDKAWCLLSGEEPVSRITSHGLPLEFYSTPRFSNFVGNKQLETFPWGITGRIFPEVLKVEDPSSYNTEGSGAVGRT